MKRIGVLTFHYVDNYGAVLQTFALRKKINSFSDCSCEIINFVPKTFEHALYMNTEESRQLLIRKREAFEKFLQINCNINTPMIEEVAGNQYDYYCVGSDQLWNMNFSNLEYLLPHVDDDAVRFSYATSVGMSIENTLNYKDLFEKYLSKFKAVSVREQEHVKIISEISKVDCSCVLDPTLLLSEQDYLPIIESEQLLKEPFILFFWLKHDNELMKGIEFVNTLSRKYHLPIVHTIYDAQSFTFNIDAGCMIYEGVEKFLWYIKNADFVVTNSYHATLFAMQFKTPFYVFVVESMRSRMDTLKKKYSIENRFIERYTLASTLDDNIDYLQIEKILQVEREKSTNYLKEALDIKI